MQRQKQLADWLKGRFPDSIFNLAPASADASFRRYFRATFHDSGCGTLLPARGRPVGTPLLRSDPSALVKPADCTKGTQSATQQAECGVDSGSNRHAAPDGTTSHSTKLSKDDSQVAGYPAPDGYTAPCRGGTLIVMDAPPQHENCLPFLHIAKLFEDAGTHVPHVYAQDLEQGFLLLSDLGNTTYLQALDANNARELYSAATDALIAIQLASRENELPPYDEALLLREMRLFPEWYIARHLQTTLDEKQNATLEAIFRRIVKNNLAQPRVYVHRDYHSRNLMYIESPPSNSLGETTSHSTKLPKTAAKSLVIPQAGEEANEKGDFLTSPGILDFQDAVYGPITYDLASLFKDAYIRWEEEQIMDWLVRYWEKARKSGLPVHNDFGKFYRDYEWMGVQRHLKVLGIFARLYHRDGKEGYLKDMPLVMGYLRRACERYIDLKPLLRLLDQLEARKPEAGFTF